MSYNNIPPIKYKINNTEFLVVNAPNNIAILNEKGIIIKKLPVFSNIKEIAKYKDGNNTRIGILTENFIYVFEPINRTIIRKIPCDSTSKLFTDNSSIFYAGIEKNILIIKDNLLPATNYPIEIEILILANTQWKMRSDPDNIIKLRRIYYVEWNTLCLEKNVKKFKV